MGLLSDDITEATVSEILCALRKLLAASKQSGGPGSYGAPHCFVKPALGGICWSIPQSP